MFCPKCGAESEAGDAFCRSCGAPLDAPPSTPGARPSTRERFNALIGTSRAARLTTAGIVAALAIALIAIIVMPSESEQQVPQDAYTLAADKLCVSKKRQIAAAQRESLKDNTPASLGRYSDEVVVIVTEWRSRLQKETPPADRAATVAELETALLDVAVESGALARIARKGTSAEIVEQATRVDAATARVENAIRKLALERCSQLSVKLGAVIDN